ncbi:hypothetical protein HN011_000144 [Eciton burchellii]|nr:hypothetical protein HN011_000144 [Eciton burchellii]
MLEKEKQHGMMGQCVPDSGNTERDASSEMPPAKKLRVAQPDDADSSLRFLEEEEKSRRNKDGQRDLIPRCFASLFQRAIQGLLGI